MNYNYMNQGVLRPGHYKVSKIDVELRRFIKDKI